MSFQEASSCPPADTTTAKTFFSVTTITIITLLFAITIVLVFLLFALTNRKRRAIELPFEPISEMQGRRGSAASLTYDYDEKSIHPAWHASSSTGPQRPGPYPLSSMVPPALSPLNSSDGRETRLNLVRHSLLGKSQRSDWDAFESSRHSKMEQPNKTWQQRKDDDRWALWV